MKYGYYDASFVGLSIISNERTKVLSSGDSGIQVRVVDTESPSMKLLVKRGDMLSTGNKDVRLSGAIDQITTRHAHFGLYIRYTDEDNYASATVRRVNSTDMEISATVVEDGVLLDISRTILVSTSFVSLRYRIDSNSNRIRMYYSTDDSLENNDAGKAWTMYFDTDVSMGGTPPARMPPEGRVGVFFSDLGSELSDTKIYMDSFYESVSDYFDSFDRDWFNTYPSWMGFTETFDNEEWNTLPSNENVLNKFITEFDKVESAPPDTITSNYRLNTESGDTVSVLDSYLVNSAFVKQTLYSFVSAPSTTNDIYFGIYFSQTLNGEGAEFDIYLQYLNDDNYYRVRFYWLTTGWDSTARIYRVANGIETVLSTFDPGQGGIKSGIVYFRARVSAGVIEVYKSQHDTFFAMSYLRVWTLVGSNTDVQPLTYEGRPGYKIKATAPASVKSWLVYK